MLIDIHTHILPGIDDGSKDIETSLAMLKEEENSGIKEVILTPHTGFNTSQWYEKDELNNFFLSFLERAKDYNVKLYLGSEVLVTPSFTKGLKENRIKSLNDSKYLLIEFKFKEEEENIFNGAYNATCFGYIPIIAHPERYMNMSLDLAYKLKEIGSLLQINTTSILGQFGHHVKRMAKTLLKKGLVDLVASDSHSMGIRHPNLKSTLDLIKKKYHVDIKNELPLLHEKYEYKEK